MLSLKFREKLLAFRRHHGTAGNINEFHGSCGINIVFNLSSNALSTQLATLIEAFQIHDKVVDEDDDDDNYNDSGKGLVMLSDTVDSYNWSETKAVASFVIEPVMNPNSGNKIVVYGLTQKDLKKLVKKLPENMYDKYFGEPKPKAVAPLKKTPIKKLPKAQRRYVGSLY